MLVGTTLLPDNTQSRGKESQLLLLYWTTPRPAWGRASLIKRRRTG